MIESSLHLTVCQFAPRLRAPAANCERLADLLDGAGGELALTPELSLTGYDVGDDAAALARPVVVGRRPPWPWPETGTAVLLGAIDTDASGVPFNCALLVEGGRVTFKQRKIHLPTYGMFDEARFFGRGDRLGVMEVHGWRVGVLICEDFWHPGLAYVLAHAGIHVLLVQAAAPGRGAWEGGEGGGTFASTAVWERIARTTAQLYGIYVALANRTGVEGAVTFAGGSLVAAPDGSIAAHASDATDCLLSVELDPAAIVSARRPYAHIRDDDPDLVCRELARLRPPP